MINEPERVQKGIGRFHGPARNAQYNRIVELVAKSLPVFAASVIKEKIVIEDGLNSQLALFIAKRIRQDNLPFIVLHQSMEDMTRGNSPRPDIGFYLDAEDEAESPKRITVFEGKRLTTRLETMRGREYVIGHVKNEKYIKGGIERFKHSIHGGQFLYAGMIGYIQDGSPASWLEQINSWISDLADQKTTPSWSTDEQLRPLQSTEQFSETTSIVKREADQLLLTHLWVSLVE